MPRLKYTGQGISAVGVNFTEGEYDLSDKAAKYLLETFPKNFTDLSNTAVVKEVPVVEEEVTEEAPSEPIVEEESPKEEPKPTSRRRKSK